MSGDRRATTSSIENSQDLKQQHDLALQQNADWLTLWELFSEHPWFQKQLQTCAIKASKRFHAPREWIHDIEQDAMIRFGEQLQRDPTLGFESSRGSYSGWIYVLLRTCCLKALRQFRESRQTIGEPSEGEKCEDSLRPVRIKLEVLEELHRLPKSQRQALSRYIAGVPVSEIASEQQMSLRSAYRLIEASLNRLKERFDVN